jgi:hypothetical protein
LALELGCRRRTTTVRCRDEFGERCVHAGAAAILADPPNEWTKADRYATDEMFDRFPEG